MDDDSDPARHVRFAPAFARSNVPNVPARAALKPSWGELFVTTDSLARQVLVKARDLWVRKSKDPVLECPLDWGIEQTGDTDAMWKTAFQRCVD
jgi:hypothetical protein